MMRVYGISEIRHGNMDITYIVGIDNMKVARFIEIAVNWD